VRAVSEPHFVADSDRPDRIVQPFLDEVVPGGYLLLPHGTHAEHSEEGSSEQTVRQATALYSRTVEPFHLRGQEEVIRLFGDLDLVDPASCRSRRGGRTTPRRLGPGLISPNSAAWLATTLRGAATALLASRPLWVNSGRWPDGLT
jgi:hypothetical protein